MELNSSVSLQDPRSSVPLTRRFQILFICSSWPRNCRLTPAVCNEYYFALSRKEKKKHICGNIAEVLFFFFSHSRYNTYKLHLLRSAEATKPTLWLNLKDKRTERYFDFNVWFFFFCFFNLCTNTFYRVIYASRVVPTTPVQHAVLGSGCFTTHI